MRQVRVRGRIRAAAGLLGPAFVASVAYVDPGNFAANFAGGAEHGYELVWVIMMANLMAILVQYLTAKAGLCTGRSLPELCRERFGRRANVMLWLQAEVVAMATDLAEFTAAAVGINLIFGLPLFPAGLITAIVASGEPPVRGHTPAQIPRQAGERLELPASRIQPDLMVSNKLTARPGQHPPPLPRTREIPRLKPQVTHRYPPVPPRSIPLMLRCGGTRRSGHTT
jgi:hypothetical protein